MLTTILARGTNKVRGILTGKLMPKLNRILLNGFGVRFGQNCQIAAVLNIRIDRKAEVVIGDNFHVSGSALTNPLNNRRTCIAVSDNAILRIGNDVGMSAPTIYIQDGLVIGNNVNIGGGCVILDSDCHSLNYMDRRNGIADQRNKKSKPIVIEDDVWLGTNSIVLKGVTIGARTIIGAGSVVTKDIPADCIAAGNPCKVIRKIL